MSQAHSHANTVPRPALIAAGALVAVSLALTAAVRIGWLERTAVPELARAANMVAPVSSRELTFADREDGAVVIAEAGSGAKVAVIETQTPGGGFIRGVLRSMARERRLHGIGSSAPFTLTLWSDGSLSLADHATGRTVELGAFGPDNRAIFLTLIDAGQGQ